MSAPPGRTNEASFPSAGTASGAKGVPIGSTTFAFPVRVYYANYLKFMERARTEWLDAHGLPLAELERVHGVVFVVTRAEIDFRGAGSACSGRGLQSDREKVRRARAALRVHGGRPHR